MKDNKKFEEEIPLAKHFSKKMFPKYSKVFEYDYFWQTCLIGLWKACENFNGNEKVWGSFAWTCMRNELTTEKWKQFEKNGVRLSAESVSLDLSYDDGDPVYDVAEEPDYAGEMLEKEVKAEMLTLKENQRKAIIHYYWDSMNLTQIGKKLGTSKTTARNLIDAGESLLRKKFGKKSAFGY